MTHLALLDTSARPDTEERREARRKGIENVKVGKFIGVSRSLLPSLVAKRNLETPLAEEVQAMAERCGQEAYIRQQMAILGRIDSRPTLPAIKVPTLIGVGTEDILTPAELAEEMVLTNAELSFLQERRVAYENLAKRTGLEIVQAVTQALIQAERYGTPIAQALRVLAQESRDQRMNEAEKKAAALPPKLTVPMILFFLPVLIAVILGPAGIQVSDKF